jgi:hypothetical protein
MNKAIERRSRRQPPRTLCVMRYAMEDISSAIFILQNHHATRSPSRTVNVNPIDRCQTGYDYMQAYGIDKNNALKIKI